MGWPRVYRYALAGKAQRCFDAVPVFARLRTRDLPRTTAAPAIGAGCGLLCSRCDLAAGLAEHTRHPAPCAEYTAHQRRQIQICIEPGPVQPQTSRADLDSSQVGGARVSKPLRQVYGHPELKPIAQAHDNARSPPVIARGDGARLPLQARLHALVSLSNIGGHSDKSPPAGRRFSEQSAWATILETEALGNVSVSGPRARRSSRLPSARWVLNEGRRATRRHPG